jgi:drug/metabolite transporter (DMT)-like permease
VRRTCQQGLRRVFLQRRHFYGLAWLLLATLGTQFGVTHMEAGCASVIIILELVTAVASALWIGGERMSVTEMVGGALILAAAVFEARRAV